MKPSSLLIAIFFLFVGLPLAQAQVGIGTTTPSSSAALDIQAPASDKGLLVPRLSPAQRRAITAPPQGLLVFQPGTATLASDSVGFWYATGQTYANGKGKWLYLPDKTTSGDNLGNHTATQSLNLTNQLLVGGTAAAPGTSGLAVDGAGHVGIGAPAPSTRLSITPTLVEPKITLWDGGSTTSHYGFGVSGSQLNYHVASTSNSHVFYGGGKNGDGKEVMRIVGYGRVGIGTAGPYSALHVRDTTSTNQIVGYFEGNNQYYAGFYVNTLKASSSPFFGYSRQDNLIAYHLVDNSNNWYLNLFNNTIGNFITPLTAISSTGNVGVGISNPLTRLSLASNTLEAKITLWDGGISTTHFGLGVSYEQLNYHVAQSADSHVFYMGGKNGNGTELMRISGNGRVGIGISNPQQLLHVYSPTPGAKIRIQSAGTTGYGPAAVEFWSDPPGSSGEWRPGMIRSTDQATGTYTGGLAFYVNGTSYAHRQDSIEVMRLTNGLMGLGTPTPNTRFSISPGNLEAKITLWDGGSTANHDGFGVSAYQLNYHVSDINTSHVFYAQGKNGNGTELARLTGTGNLGIGLGQNVSPAFRLHVSDSNSGDQVIAQFEGSNSSFAGTYVNTNTAGAGPFYGYKQLGTIVGYHYINSGGDWVLNVNNNTRMTVDGPTGNVGIGTTSPSATLHVVGTSSLGSPNTTHSYFCVGQTSLTASTATGNRSVVAYFTGGQFWVNDCIVAGTLNVSSDIRLKHVIGQSNGAADLSLLNKIRVTDYTYIDQKANTDKVVKKVIAQEVQAVLPAAITASTQAIPSVYEKASSVQCAEGRVSVRSTKAHGFVTGDRVRLYTPLNAEVNAEVVVVNAHEFTFLSPITTYEELFIYGKYVSDLLSVDYDAIAMLNVSATQELARQLATLQSQYEVLQQCLGRVEARAQVQSNQFEQRLRTLEQTSTTGLAEASR